MRMLHLRSSSGIQHGTVAVCTFIDDESSVIVFCRELELFSTVYDLETCLDLQISIWRKFRDNLCYNLELFSTVYDIENCLDLQNNICYPSNWCSECHLQEHLTVKWQEKNLTHVFWVLTDTKHVFNWYINRGTNKFVRFFLEIWGFIVKNRLQCYHSKYCPSLATTFSHLSVNLILSWKNDVDFDAIHESTHFSDSS